MKPAATAILTRGNKIVGLLFILAVCAAPLSAHAAIQITEVMYDASGSDTGREWIEVANTGSAAIDMAGYKLFEGGVNHTLTVAVGTTTLAAGEAAVIANNSDKFLLDFPTYSGTLFKSSFSLSNTGEGLVLKDNKLATVDTVSYTSTLGASGDGNSLHKNGSGWMVGAPNPGSLAVSAPLLKSAPAAKTSATKTSTSKSKTSAIPNSSGSSQTAAVGDVTPAAAPAQESSTILWTAALGLCVLIVLGVGGVLYARAGVPKGMIAETAPSAEEFEIE